LLFSEYRLAGGVSLIDDGRCAVQVESGLFSTFLAVFIVEFLNISIITSEFSLGSVPSAIGVVPEVNKTRIYAEVEAIPFLRGLGQDLIYQLRSCSLVEIIGDGLDRKVLVGHPGLFGRILVPNLSDGTIFHPILIGSDVSFYTIEEDGVVGGGAAHGVKALVAELSDIETKIVLSAHLIGSVACHVIIGEAFFLFHRA